MTTAAKSYTRRSDAILTADHGCTSLVCPRCGSHEMHQCSVIVYHRDDDELTEVTTVDAITGEHRRYPHGTSLLFHNPSDRRQGLTIKFWCEQCTDAEWKYTYLHIYQHKGTTFIEWEYIP